MKNIADYSIYALFRFCIFCTNVIGYSGRKCFIYCIYLLFFYIVRYRRNVVHTNLCAAFPAFTSIQILHQEKKYYKNLSRTIIESLASYSWSKEKVLKNVKLFGVNEGQSNLYLGSHSSNWELACLAVGLIFKPPIYLVYKPIKNKYIDSFVKIHRSKFNIHVLSPILLTKILASQNNESKNIVMLIDQFPGNFQSNLMVTFFGIETFWFNGAQKLIDRYQLNTNYFKITFDDNEGICVEITSIDDPKTSISSFVNYLENDLKKMPHNWLWSHKRWKNITNFYKK